MARLIDADVVVSAVVNTPSEVAKCHTYNVLSSLAERQHEILDIIEKAPTVDAAPVVHGHWINETTTAKGLSIYRFVCSVCGHIFYNAGIDNFSYCPACGAKMDGEEADRRA